MQSGETIRNLLEQTTLEPNSKKYIKDIAIALEALALIKSGKPDDGYGVMVKHGTFSKAAIEWILHNKYWSLLHQNRKKLAFILEIKMEDFIIEFNTEQPETQAYPDIQGNIIQP